MNEGKTKAAQKQQTISFVTMSVSQKKLPTVPSHNNRSNSDRSIIEAHLNQNILYQDYTKEMFETGKKRIACLQIFKKIFNEFNKGFDEQKKDKRSLREQIGNDKNVESLSDNEKLKYKQHTKEKKATQTEIIRKV